MSNFMRVNNKMTIPPNDKTIFNPWAKEMIRN